MGNGKWEMKPLEWGREIGGCEGTDDDIRLD